MGNWSLISRKDAEIHIHNSDGQQQTTILRDDLPGFIFESNRGTKHSFIAETSLGKFIVLTFCVRSVVNKRTSFLLPILLKKLYSLCKNYLSVIVFTKKYVLFIKFVG